MLDLPPPVPAIEFNLATRGISKGLAQTKGPQLLVRGELASGHLFFGAYAKNVTSTSSDGEAGLSVGLRATAAGLDVAASATWKRAIDPAAGSDANALEVSTSASRRFGRLTPKLSAVWSPNDLGSTGRTLFAEAGMSYRLVKALSASAALGRRQRTGGPDYTAWNAGFAWSYGKRLTLDARYYDTDGGSAQPYRARVVLAARLKL
jgi:hypothetical protein